MSSELHALIALSMVPGIGPVLAQNLIAYCGSADAVFTASSRQLLAVPGIGQATAQALQGFKDYQRVDAELRFIEAHKLQVHAFHQASYPNRLKHIHGAPVVLYQHGPLNLDASRVVAVVGTRRSTAYGRALTESFIEGLTPYGPCIVSGMALGIDSVAHQAALKVGLPTLAVLGNGLKRIYPSRNTRLARRILEQGGAMVTEFVSDTPPNRENFPRRNRIVAGMADALVVVESSAKGGSLITARLAFDFDREVCAFPGRVGSPQSAGCHKIIKRHQAHLIEHAEDLANLMQWETQAERTKEIYVPTNLSIGEQRIFDTLQEHGAVHIDWLAHTLQLELHNLSSCLMQLELNNVIRSLPGNRVEIA